VALQTCNALADTSSRSLMHFTHKESREVVGDRRIPAPASVTSTSSRDQNLDLTSRPLRTTSLKVTLRTNTTISSIMFPYSVRYSLSSCLARDFRVYRYWARSHMASKIPCFSHRDVWGMHMCDTYLVKSWT